MSLRARAAFLRIDGRFTALLAALPALAGCAHAAGLPSGPPPEYEDTPLPTSLATTLPGDAGALPTHAPALTAPAPLPVSAPPARH